MNDTTVNAMLAYLVLREVFYIYSTQKLINKIMSRNYHEFRTAENVQAPHSKPIRHEEVDEANDAAEELNSALGL